MDYRKLQHAAAANDDDLLGQLFKLHRMRAVQGMQAKNPCHVSPKPMSWKPK